MSAVKKPKAKPPRRPIYFRVEKLVRSETGEIVGALVPRYACDARSMRDRKYKTGTELRADLKKPRNAKFHRLGHSIGELAADHIEGFEELEAHAAVKRLQLESGVCCEVSEMDLGPLGVVAMKVPRSISFDEMEESDFNKLVLGTCAWIREKYHGVPPAELEEIIEAVEQGQ